MVGFSQNRSKRKKSLTNNLQTYRIILITFGLRLPLFYAQRAREHCLVRRTAIRRECVSLRSYAYTEVYMDGTQTISKWFSDEAECFVLHVKTYEERRTAQRLQAHLDPERYVVFVPMKDRLYEKKRR